MRRLIKSLKVFFGVENIITIGQNIYLDCSKEYDYEDYFDVLKDLNKNLPEIFKKITYEHNGYKNYDEDGNSYYEELIHLKKIETLNENERDKLCTYLDERTVNICEKCKLLFTTTNGAKQTNRVCNDCDAITCISSYLFQK